MLNELPGIYTIHAASRHIYIQRILLSLHMWILYFINADDDRETFKRVTHIDWRLDRSSMWLVRAAGTQCRSIIIPRLYEGTPFFALPCSLRECCCCPINYYLKTLWSKYVYLKYCNIVYTDRWFTVNSYARGVYDAASLMNN